MSINLVRPQDVPLTPNETFGAFGIMPVRMYCSRLVALDAIRRNPPSALNESHKSTQKIALMPTEHQWLQNPSIITDPTTSGHTLGILLIRGANGVNLEAKAFIMNEYLATMFMSEQSHLYAEAKRVFEGPVGNWKVAFWYKFCEAVREEFDIEAKHEVTKVQPRSLVCWRGGKQAFL